MFASADPAGVTTCHPRSRVQSRHGAASAPSSSAMAGGFFGAVWAAAGWAAASGHCKDKSAQPSRLMPEARADSLDQFFDFIGFLEGGEGKNIAVVLLQVRLQLLREFRQFGRVFQILLVFR